MAFLSLIYHSPEYLTQTKMLRKRIYLSKRGKVLICWTCIYLFRAIIIEKRIKLLWEFFELSFFPNVTTEKYSLKSEKCRLKEIIKNIR